LHIPKIEELPLGIDGYLITAIGYFRAFMEIFPPLEVMFTAFLWYMGFKLTLVVLRNVPFLRLKV